MMEKSEFQHDQKNTAFFGKRRKKLSQFRGTRLKEIGDDIAENRGKIFQPAVLGEFILSVSKTKNFSVPRALYTDEKNCDNVRITEQKRP